MPTVDPIDENAVGAYSRTWEMLVSKYNTAGSWATWAQNVLDNSISDIEDLLGDSSVNDKINEVIAILDSMADFIARDISFQDNGFDDQVLSDLKSAISNGLSSGGTGLGDAESLIFNKHSARISAERAKAYNEIANQFVARGFDMPPGSLLLKQTEVSNETNIRLADASADIMQESARLAVDFNKSLLASANQLVDVMGRLYDSKVMRAFEAAKTEAQLAVEAFKANVSVIEAKAGLASKGAELAIHGLLQQMQIRVSALQGLAQNASQMIASALNSVQASTAFSYSAQAQSSSSTTIGNYHNDNYNVNTAASSQTKILS